MVLDAVFVVILQEIQRPFEFLQMVFGLYLVKQDHITFIMIKRSISKHNSMKTFLLFVSLQIYTWKLFRQKAHLSLNFPSSHVQTHLPSMCTNYTLRGSKPHSWTIGPISCPLCLSPSLAGPFTILYFPTERAEGIIFQTTVLEGWGRTAEGRRGRKRERGSLSGLACSESKGKSDNSALNADFTPQ